MLPLLIYSNIFVPPPISLCAASPYSLKPESVSPPSLRIVRQDNTMTTKTTTRSCKENWRKIRCNPIHISILILIRSTIMFPIQLRHLSPSPPPLTFLVANPGGSDNPHPQPGTSPGLYRCHSRLLTPPLRTLQNIVFIIIFIIALPQIGVGKNLDEELTH